MAVSRRSRCWPSRTGSGGHFAAGGAGRRLLPGYARPFIERAAPLLDIGIEGDLDREFELKPLKPFALDPLLPVLEGGRRLSLRRREGGDAGFLRPGGPVFDRVRSLVFSR